MRHQIKLWGSLPYSGFISREKKFANFADLCSYSRKYYSQIFACALRHLALVRGVANVKAIRENFIREIC